ncbi:MAG: hypothetical protein F6K54_02005 [Okeania sp. SIO3B5]|uniref:hypothetical protein n=1 Tax=Okeania sp. SIO3B5 TaxID=2607811 RepID=UPI001401253F|nr:hypothetical protein [Okeania sp. SIO3B5]NEO51971.1 hypothetical protein [Okeania sp. SIO3B5]
MKSPIEIVAKAAVKVKLACMSAAVATLMFCPAALAQVEVTVENIIDVRDNAMTDNNSGLAIDLKFLGDMLVDAKAMRVNVDRAIDETGKSIVNNESEESESEFEEISFPGHNFTRVNLTLKSPTRQAATIKEISGTLEMFIPDQNSKSTVTVKNFQEKTGVPISSSVLKYSDIEVLIQKPEDVNQDQCPVDQQATQQEEDSVFASSLTSFFSEIQCGIYASTFASIQQDKSVIILIRDADSKLKGIEFESESGEVILPAGSFAINDSEEEVRVYGFKEKLPSKAQLNLYVFTSESSESVVKVPFKVVDIPLP